MIQQQALVKGTDDLKGETPRSPEIRDRVITQAAWACLKAVCIPSTSSIHQRHDPPSSAVRANLIPKKTSIAGKSCLPDSLLRHSRSMRKSGDYMMIARSVRITASNKLKLAPKHLECQALDLLAIGMSEPDKPR